MENSYDFEVGDLCVYSINVSSIEHGVKPATVFRVTEIDNEYNQLRGDVLWSNDERVVDSDTFSPPFVHCKTLE